MSAIEYIGILCIVTTVFTLLLYFIVDPCLLLANHFRHRDTFCRIEMAKQKRERINKMNKSRWEWHVCVYWLSVWAVEECQMRQNKWKWNTTFRHQLSLTSPFTESQQLIMAHLFSASEPFLKFSFNFNFLRDATICQILEATNQVEHWNSVTIAGPQQQQQQSVVHSFVQLCILRWHNWVAWQSRFHISVYSTPHNSSKTVKFACWLKNESKIHSKCNWIELALHMYGQSTNFISFSHMLRECVCLRLGA